MDGYPKRHSHFAHKFVRMMFKQCLANEIGQDAVVLLAFIAHTEDAARYLRPVTFFNEQLAVMSGFKTVKSMDRARTKAIKAGWLHYVPGTKSVAGKYWVLIPDHYVDVDDLPSDEGENDDFLVKNDQESGRNPGGIREENCFLDKIDLESGEESARQAPGKRQASGQHSTLSLPLSLKEELRARQKSSDDCKTDSHATIRTLMVDSRDVAMSESERTDAFEQFWFSSKNKEGGRLGAYEAWMMLPLTPNLYAEIMTGLSAWNRSERWARLVFVNMGTWIRESRWLDPPAAGKKKIEAAEADSSEEIHKRAMANKRRLEVLGDKV